MKPEPMQHTNALPNTQSPLVKWLDQYGNGATIVACVAMIGGAIWYSYSRTSSSRSEAAWAMYSQARTAEDFGNVADAYSNTEVGTWARLGEGERLVDSGISLMFTDREGALGELKKADEAFRKVLGNRSGSEIARERAAWGLAKSTEAQSDSDTTKAIEGYTALLSQFPKSIYKAAAEERIESLKSPGAKEFYAWFHKQHPKPPDLKKPKDGLPEGHPPIDSLLDDKPEGDKSESKKPEAKDDDKSEESKSDAKKDAKDSEAEKTPDDKPKKDDDAAAKDDSSKKMSAIVEKLQKKTDVSFNDQPFEDSFAFLGKFHDVQFQIDSDALQAAGVEKSTGVTLALTGVSVLEAIGEIFRQIEPANPSDSLVLVIEEAEKRARITTSATAKKDKLVPVTLPKKTEKPKGEDKDAPAESK